MSALDLIAIISTALVCSAAGLYFFGRQTKSITTRISNDEIDEISLLFKGDTLQHASTGGMRIANFDEASCDWTTLRNALIERFPDFPVLPTETAGTLTLQAVDNEDIAKLEIRKIDSSTHIQLIDQETLPLDVQHKIKTLEAQAKITGFAGSSAPYPIWHLDPDGTVGWYNTAYQTLYQRVFGESPQKDKLLFEMSDMTNDPLSSSRRSVKSMKGEKVFWFDISSVKIEAGRMFHAIDINAVIDAEIAQRNFVQTLAKTFAQLSIGLSIFDRNGQLALFNPALVDLTALPAEFLSSRPDLLSFFDRLRDNRVMPEPKNYHSWRQEISDVIAAATDGRYQETWTLDSGQTYRVSGRPHPDGAIAFLIEDISAEVSLARSFRSELELGQSMMNTFDTGLVVFSSSGILQFCNSAYREMWKLDPENTFVDVTILDSIRDWQNQSQPNPAWGDIRDFVMKVGERVQWESRIIGADGCDYDCVVKPIALGATVVRFEPVSKPNVVDEEKRLELQD